MTSSVAVFSLPGRLGYILYILVLMCVVYTLYSLVYLDSITVLLPSIEASQQPAPGYPTTLHQHSQEQIQLLQQKQRQCEEDITKPTPHDLLVHNKHWQVARSTDHKDANISRVVLFSVYVDDRQTDAPGLMITGVITVRNQTPKWSPASLYTPTLYGLLWYHNVSVPTYVSLTAIQPGPQRFMDNTTYSPIVLRCLLPKQYSNTFVKPVYFSVMVNSDECTKPTTYMKVKSPERSMPMHDFGICMAISFGKIPITTFIEWIEFNRLLGVTEINIYDSGLHGSVQKALQYYTSTNIIKRIPITSPVESRTVQAKRLASEVVLTDCMIKNMYRYRYMVTMDFDELILPYKSDKLSSLLQEIDEWEGLRESAKSYTFRNTYHFLTFRPDDSQPKTLRSMKYRQRVEPTPFPTSCKSIVDPRKCLVNHFHYCLVSVEEETDNWTVDVPIELAVSHHYRDIPSSYRHTNVTPATTDDDSYRHTNVTPATTDDDSYRHTDVTPATTDDDVLRFKPQLETAVDAVMKAIP